MVLLTHLMINKLKWIDQHGPFKNFYVLSYYKYVYEPADTLCEDRIEGKKNITVGYVSMVHIMCLLRKRNVTETTIAPLFLYTRIYGH